MQRSLQAMAACVFLTGTVASAQEGYRAIPLPMPSVGGTSTSVPGRMPVQPMLSLDHSMSTAEPPIAQGPMRRCLNKFGLGCNAHHSWFGCGNFRSEMTFIFGSCRTFYGEPCYPKPPHTGPLSRAAAGGRFFNGAGLFNGGGFGLFKGDGDCSGCR